MLGEWNQAMPWNNMLAITSKRQTIPESWLVFSVVTTERGLGHPDPWLYVSWWYMMIYSGLYIPFIFISKHFLISILQKPFGLWLLFPLMFKLSLGSATVPVTEASAIPSDGPSFLSSVAHMEVGWLIHPGDGYYRRIFQGTVLQTKFLSFS